MQLRPYQAELMDILRGAIPYPKWRPNNKCQQRKMVMMYLEWRRLGRPLCVMSSWRIKPEAMFREREYSDIIARVPSIAGIIGCLMYRGEWDAAPTLSD